jgi:hypothetical protein
MSLKIYFYQNITHAQVYDCLFYNIASAFLQG